MIASVFFMIVSRDKRHASRSGRGICLRCLIGPALTIKVAKRPAPRVEKMIGKRFPRKMRLECYLRLKSDCCPVSRQGLFLNLKSILQDSLVQISPVPWQLGQIISPEPVHLAQSASPIVDNSGRLIGLFRLHARQSIVPTPSHL